MRAIIYLALTFVAINLQAASLECKSLINLDEVTNSVVVTSLNNKVLIDKVDEITSYITEKSPNVFSLEAFIPSLEMRIYSEAAINNVGENLTATAWAREILVDVVCKRIK